MIPRLNLPVFKNVWFLKCVVKINIKLPVITGNVNEKQEPYTE
jgi:hypothetical protein